MGKTKITWYIKEKNLITGTFKSGDPWVVGPITILGVHPAPQTVHKIYINGSMLDPVNGIHSYDSRAHGFDSEHGVKFPKTIDTNSSLVSTVSVPIGDPLTENQSFVKAASVLTVLMQEPEEDSLRPGLIGKKNEDFRLIKISEINWDKLPSLLLPRTTNTPSVSFIKSRYVDGLKRPWLLHNGSWTSREIMPRENSPDYIQYYALLLSEASVYCLTDWSDNDEDEKELIINYLQLALDYYTMQTNGGGARGAFNFRWPIIFAGIMLGDDNMKNLWINGNYSTPSYADAKVYTYADAKRTRQSKVLSLGESWTGATVLWRNEIGDLGEHENLHPTEWENQDFFTILKTLGNTQEGYRRMHTPYMVGFSLCVQIYDAEAELAFPDYIPYVKRWMSESKVFLESKGFVPNNDTHPVQTSRNAYVDERWKIINP